MREWPLILLAAVLALPAPGRADDLQNPLPLTRTALVTDIDAPLDPDDPGTGGGFDMSSYFKTMLTTPDQVAVCIDTVEKTVSAWAGDLDLVRNFQQRDAASLTVHYSKANLAGIFAIRYEVQERTAARVRVDYYKLDGSKQAPESAKALLEPWKIASLEDNLDKALHCQGSKP